MIPIRFFIIFLVVLLTSCTSGTVQKEEFCGTSTNGYCTMDTECTTDGCSGQVCRATSEEPVITTCEWKACYDAQTYSVSCRCVQGACQWGEGF